MEIVSAKFAKLIDQFEEITEASDEKTAEDWLGDAGLLVNECKAVQEKMQTDKSLRIRVGGDDPKENVVANSDSKASIDLLGVKCPFNYVKTKIKLETMAPGSILEVLLDSGEPSENVPKSIKNDGHKVVSLVEEKDHYKLTIEKA